MLRLSLAIVCTFVVQQSASAQEPLPDWPDGSAEQAVEALDTDQKAKLRLRPFSCLMNCSRACSAAVSAADGSNKVSYVLGDFEPDREAAEALVGYALGHAASDTGVVPFKTWPQGVKGHFIARVPARREPEE